MIEATETTVETVQRCRCGGSFDYVGSSGRVERNCPYAARGLCPSWTHPYTETRYRCDACGAAYEERDCACPACAGTALEGDEAKATAANPGGPSRCQVDAVHRAHVRWDPIWGRLVA